MNSRRSFIRKATAISAIPTLSSFVNLTQPRLEEIQKEALKKSPTELAEDEDFWSFIKQSYTVSPQIINLNNGGVSPSPKPVQDSLERLNHYANECPSYYMWGIMDQGREPLRENIAKFAGVSPEEIAFNRNTTEALDTIILGMPLQKGDEVILCEYDYPNMLNAWRQREMRDGIVLKWIDLKLPSDDKKALTQPYLDAITGKTKVIHVTHMINYNGQIMPVKEISDLAHKKGIEVVCDGAHTFAHIDFKIPDLGCDYFGTSLHKWLGAPIGNGLLWMKKEKIATVYPLLPNPNPKTDNIRKFENLGTRSFMIEQSIGEALNFQYALGNERKEARLRYLRDYWAKNALAISDRVSIQTSLSKEFSCALAVVGIDGLMGREIAKTFFDKYKIHTTQRTKIDINGSRVTPHVYTSINDLDRLLTAIEYLTKG
ncbi:aminotransferase class V-fold PLP-dependent enzyme [Arcticibacterium luteifluviistationis]|uniref:Aminotransferase n=1 Tax=Arcticibacterium luteifluviistationis TaxID=1784714 RepID=A0A2Z4GED7_9BACT|nr:aminotransferase class V-fold PLP-dependent enzyme [Arcticibacterium luteifluviistationis]AWV99616.1 aminotransferase [Arcticibacterium luteifluviistationis]